MIGDILLVAAVTVDAFLAAFTYGAGRIKIPFMSAVIISLVGSFTVTAAILLSGAAGELVNYEYCRYISFVLLLLTGIISLFQNGLKAVLRRRQGNGKLRFHLSDVDFVIQVILDETKADADSSKVLSSGEAVTLALALSLDSLSGGLGAGLGEINAVRVCVMSFVFGLLAIGIGSRIGAIAGKTRLELSWVSGVFLIILALFNLTK